MIGQQENKNVIQKHKMFFTHNRFHLWNRITKPSFTSFLRLHMEIMGTSKRSQMPSLSPKLKK